VGRDHLPAAVAADKDVCEPENKVAGKGLDVSGIRRLAAMCVDGSGRTGVCAVRAKDAAVAGLWAQDGFA